MIDRRFNPKSVPIRPEVHARFLEVIKRRDAREAEATTSLRLALARANARKKPGGNGWRARAAESRKRRVS